MNFYKDILTIIHFYKQLSAKHTPPGFPTVYAQIIIGNLQNSTHNPSLSVN